MTADNVKPSHTVNVKDLPDSARRSLLVARSLYAFSRLLESKAKGLDPVLEALKKEVIEARLIAHHAGVAPVPDDQEDWTAPAVRKRAGEMWTLGLLVLQRREAELGWHPEVIDVSKDLGDDPVLKVSPGSDWSRLREFGR